LASRHSFLPGFTLSGFPDKIRVPKTLISFNYNTREGIFQIGIPFLYADPFISSIPEERHRPELRRQNILQPLYLKWPVENIFGKRILLEFGQEFYGLEKYYRWVSRRYARTFGRLHKGLVDTIFRYNRRQDRGLYLASMAHLYRYDARDEHTGGFAQIKA